MISEPSAGPSEQSKHSREETNSSGSSGHSEEESGNENRQKRVRKRKRAHKGSENDKSKNTKVSCRSGKRGCGGQSKQKQVEAVTLFEVITMGKSAMKSVIDDWIEAYQMDRDSSLLDLISFFIQCAGCKGVVTAEMCQSKEDSDVRSMMVEKLDEDTGLQYKKFLAFPWILTVTWPVDSDSVEYPLTQSGQSGRWFHSEFCDFVAVLVFQCQHSIIFDSYLMNTLISLLSELSSSYIRAFRHTCTLAAVKLLSSLVGVALSLSAGIENSQKLYNVQKMKTVRQKSTTQLDRIQRNITELQEKKAEVESMMDAIFKGIFVNRYRDVLPEIRSICMEELATWMKSYSSMFLNDSYLKHIGWMMHDKIPDVRLKCVLGLQSLYGDPFLLPKLDLFTCRFKDRIISMALDKDSEVALQTMKLLVIISKTCDEVLGPDDYKQLLQFVYSSQRPLAATAGELLFSRLLNAKALVSESPDGQTEEEVHKQQTVVRLKALLQFYLDSKMHEHVVYLVDSLWDCGGALLKDWATLTSILLQEPCSHSSGFTGTEQTVLVEILAASARQASEGPALAGRSGAKKQVMSARERKVQIEDCTRLTEHLLVVLPQLLSKFSGNMDALADLMKIPQYFLPESPKAELTQALTILLEEMKSVLDLHSGPAILEAAARTYLSLCVEETAWCVVARPARDSLVQLWVDQLTALLKDTLQGDVFCADEVETGKIVSTLRKLRAFHNCHDLSQWNVFELLSPLLPVEGGAGGAPSEVLLEVLRCLCYSMFWSLSTSGETLTSRDKALAQRLQLRLFNDRSHRCLSHPDPGVRQQAFLGVCDVLTAHSYQILVWNPASHGPLLYTPSPKLQMALLAFVCLNVFAGPAGQSQSRGRQTAATTRPLIPPEETPEKVVYVEAGEPSEVERLEDLHRRRTLLAAYCKLIVQGVLEMSLAAEIFMYYVKFYNDFGDIIKETICRTRQVDKMESARTLVVCLQQLFVRLQREQGDEERPHTGVQTFTSIKELARRFALTFGDVVKFRESVVLIHRNGIDFVFQGFSQSSETPTPPHLSFLAILAEFSCKLLKPDKRTVFSLLQRNNAENVVNLRDECWQPLCYYRSSLLAAAEGEDGASCISSDRKPGPPARSPLLKQKLEGSKSLAQLESKGTKSQQLCFSPSRQEKTPHAETFSFPVDPLARRVTVLGAGVEEGDDNVEVEV